MTTIKAILLDMDNTLLHNPDKDFALAFLQHIEQHFQIRTGQTGAAAAFRQVIRAMSVPRIGDESNWKRTIRLLAEILDQPADIIASTLLNFYTTRYHALADCISPVAGAASFINQLQARDLAIVISTNPIYPAVGIHARLQWAQLPASVDDYALVTSADNMHYAKPDPAYYAEVLGRLGVEPDEALMIGDSQRNDIDPAAQIGIHTYHVDGNLADHTDNIVALLDAPPHRKLTPQMIEPQLRGNIGALYGLLDNVEPAYWQQRPDPNEWSILQILCHLVDAEVKTQRSRLERILQEDNPFITAPKPPGPDIAACGDDGFTIAKIFKQERQATLALINQLTPAEWQRPARHSIFGLTTLLEMTYFTARHDRLHLNQLCNTIGNCDDG